MLFLSFNQLISQFHFKQILYDYMIRNESLDPNALCSKWPEVKKVVLVCVHAAAREECLGYFNEEIGYFIALIKLLSSNRAKLPEIISKFIIFSNVRSLYIFIYRKKINHIFLLLIHRMLTMIQSNLWIQTTSIRM